MKTLKLLFLSLILIGSFSCSSDDDETSTPPDDSLQLSDIVGSWKATSSVHTNNANAAESFDIIANGGEIRFTLLAHGGVRTWIDFGDFHDEYDSQASISGDILTNTPVESGRPIRRFIVSKVGNTLTLINENDAFDFTLSGDSPVTSTSVTTMVPNI